MAAIPALFRVALASLLVAGSASARTDAQGVAASALHGYVLGRAALSSSELDDAARFFAAAHAQDPAAEALTRRAFDLAVAAGDRKQAFALAAQLYDGGARAPEIAVVLLTEAILERRWARGEVLVADLAPAGYAGVVQPIITAWLDFERGRADSALAALDPQAFQGFTRGYVAEQRAHMLAAAGRYDEAAEAYAGLRARTPSGITFVRVGEADAVAQSGDLVRARAILDGSDALTVAARSRLDAGRRIGALAPDAAHGLALLAARLASDLSRDRPVPLALLFARTATFLGPDTASTWLIAGDVLARNGQREAALAAYAEVPVDDALAALAGSRRADVLETLERGDEAGALLRAAVEAEDADMGDWVRLGDWHRRAERHLAAAEAYSRALALDDTNWSLWFLRGSARERAGDWLAAEADLRQALRRRPDEAVVLNYLGYSLLDRGLRLEEASALIEKAASLQPADGSIIDSLGWSQFRQGEYEKSVVTLERAAELVPTDPTVNSHLGDAYWRTGRRIEARFRWRAALALDPSPQERTDLSARLDYGLDAALALAD